MKKYKCMGCLTNFEAEYKEDCPSCGDDSDVIEVSTQTNELSVEKLQEQLNTAKKALAEISKMADSGDMTWNSNIKAVINPALDAMGGDR